MISLIQLLFLSCLHLNQENLTYFCPSLFSPIRHSTPYIGLSLPTTHILPYRSLYMPKAFKSMPHPYHLPVPTPQSRLIGRFQIHMLQKSDPTYKRLITELITSLQSSDFLKLLMTYN